MLLSKMKITILFLVILQSRFTAQIIPDKQAPEIWSKPEVIRSFPDGYSGTIVPSVNGDGSILTWNGIDYIERTDTGWSESKKTNFPYSGEAPVISFSGTRLYFRVYSNGWDLYYSDWDRENDSWGDRINCGNGVNDPYDYETYGHQIDDTTLVFIRTSITFISHWDKSEGIWGVASPFPKEYYEFSSGFNIALTQKLEKVYRTHEGEIVDSNNNQWLNEDIFVSYKDTTNEGGYGRTYKLNICYESDSLFTQGKYQDNWEGYPAVTADGKKLFFVANYDGKLRIYESNLLKDENGNPVSVIDIENEKVPKPFQLLSPYPNPFNSQITVPVKVYSSGKGKLIVRNILGKEVKSIETQWLDKGNHSIYLNLNRFASGIYFITFLQNKTQLTYKTVLIK